jgi:hypothetical protein
MLNIVAYRTAANAPVNLTPAPTAPAPTGTPQAAAPAPVFRWAPTLRYGTIESILRWERSHMTMPSFRPGSDAHGWRNALNYYGWGSITAGVYKDFSFRTIDQAAIETVAAIAVHGMPVGILAWYGSHAQIVTGYRVVGEDPRTGSRNFTVQGVYISDPLKESHYRNTYIPIGVWRSGGPKIQFTPYLQTDSVIRDPIDGQVGRNEWRARYVVMAPAA